MADSVVNGSRGYADIAALATGCATGAAVRYATLHWWLPSPVGWLAATVLGVLVSCTVLGAALVLTANGAVRAFLAGFAAAAASISGYIALGISGPPWLAPAFIVLTPVAVLLGLATGAIPAITWGPVRRAAAKARS